MFPTNLLYDSPSMLELTEMLVSSGRIQPIDPVPSSPT